MLSWINIGPDSADKPFRESFLRIMRVMDTRYSSIEAEQFAEWLEFPSPVQGYENDRIYAFGGFANSESTQRPNSMQLALLVRHLGGNQPQAVDQQDAELLMLGWAGASADPDTLDATIDQVIEKGTEWLQVIGLAGHSVRCFRPYKMDFGNVGLLYDRICQRATARPAEGLRMIHRRAVADGEFWQLSLSK